MRASVCASSVLPQPVGPTSRMFDLASSTSLFLAPCARPLVVVVDGDRQHPLGVVLADHVVVEHLADVVRRRHAVARLDQVGLVLLADDVHAQFDAFVADEHGRPGDQLADLVLALAAERAVERVLRVAAAGFAHRHSVISPGAAPASPVFSSAVRRPGRRTSPAPGPEPDGTAPSCPRTASIWAPGRSTTT